MGNAALAAIALGGNLGDVPAAFEFALRRLAETPAVRVVAVSSAYRTPAWGKTDQPDFLNAAAVLETTLEPEALLDVLLGIEKEARRERRERWGPRPLDLDIITFGDLVMDTPRLTLPHPHATERAFVLVPLVEVEPRARIAGRPVPEWLAMLETAGIVRDDAASARVRAAVGAA